MSNAIQIALKLAQNIIDDESNQKERLQRLLRFVGWQLWKRTIAKPIRIKLFNGYNYVAYPNDDLSSAPIYFRIPDFREINFIQQHITGGILLDIGANVGLFSLLLAHKVEKAILFEPNPLAAERAKENIALNRLGFQVVVQGISDHVGHIELEDRGGTDTRNRTIIAGMGTSFPTRSVPSTTVDYFLHSQRIDKPISLVKIDVEGHENAVLRGMQNCLAIRRPMVMFEYLARTNLEETRNLFQHADYVICELKPNPVIISEIVRPLQNLLAFPRECAEQYGIELSQLGKCDAHP